MRTFTWLFLFVSLFVCNGARAQATYVEDGTATGIFYAFYTGERDFEYIPVAYAKCDDGSFVLKGFANGKDLPMYIEYEDEYGRDALGIPDLRGVGSNITFTYEGYEYWPFPVFSFTVPVDLTHDMIDFIFVDGTSYYDPDSDTIVLDYRSAIDENEYMFLVDFTMPFDDGTDGIKEHVMDGEKERMEGVFSINGTRLTAPQKGINIIDGKKVVIR